MISLDVFREFMDSILKCFEGEILLAELIKVWVV